MIFATIGGGEIVLAIVVFLIVIGVLFLLIKGVLKDIKEYNKERYMLFDDVLPKRAFLKMLKNNIEKNPELHIFSLFHAAIDKVEYLENSISKKLFRGILEEFIKRIRENMPAEIMIAVADKGEFYIYLPSEYNYDEAMQMCYTVFDRLSSPYIISQKTEINLSLSLSATFYPIHGESFTEIIKVSQTLLEEIISNGGNAVRTLQAEQDVTKSEYLDYYHELKTGIEENQFEFYYQPSKNMKTNEFVSLSLFLRWNHPTLGLLEAAKFIRVLEQSGDIYWVGLHGLEMISLQYDHLKTLLNNEDLLVVLSLSGREFLNKNLVEDFSKIIRRNKFNPKNVVLDIPVNILLKEETDSLGSVVARLKRLGFKLSTDIYAVNLYDLEKVSMQKADIVTLGRSFLEGEDRRMSGIYLDILNQMVEKNNLTVIGEKVEKEEEKDFYEQNSIHIIQGNYITEALSMKMLEEWIKDDKEVEVSVGEPIELVEELTPEVEENTLKEETPGI